jgi:hypothetical protein
MYGAGKDGARSWRLPARAVGLEASFSVIGTIYDRLGSSNSSTDSVRRLWLAIDPKRKQAEIAACCGHMLESPKRGWFTAVFIACLVNRATSW